MIGTEEFSRGEQHAREQGWDVVGFYHSHPDHPAIASGFDCEHAWPIYSYIIVSVIHGKAAGVLSWELAEDRSGFAAETIIQGE